MHAQCLEAVTPADVLDASIFGAVPGRWQHRRLLRVAAGLESASCRVFQILMSLCDGKNIPIVAAASQIVSLVLLAHVCAAG